MSFDPEDTALIAVVAFSAAVMTGNGSFDMFAVSLADETTLAGHTVTLAYAIQVGSFGFTVFTNDLPTSPSALKAKAESQLDEVYYYILVGAAALLLSWPFFPEVSSFVQSADLWSLGFILVSVGGQISLGYIK